MTGHHQSSVRPIAGSGGGDDVVLPATGVRIAPRDLTFTFARSGGPGGQNVNKVNTRVTVWFDVEGCGGLTDGQRGLVRRSLGTRIGADGRLRVVSSRHRTQSANRRAALNRLVELLDAALSPPTPRTRTRVPPRTRQHRLTDKRTRSGTKQLRRPPGGDGE